jgi:hypothetical protein
VVELLTNRQQPRPVVRAQEGPVAAELAADDIDLGFQEADTGVPTCGPRFEEEVQSDVEPAPHGL